MSLFKSADSIPPLERNMEKVKNFAHIAPGKLLKELTGMGYHHPHYVVLAHDIVENPKDYTWMHNENPGVVILDNSIIELGHAVGRETMARAAEIVNPTYITLPDVMGDFRGTLDKVESALRTWGFDDEWQYIAVVQGGNMEQVEECATHYVEMGIKAVCIPRIMTAQHGSRKHAIDIVSRMPFDFVHLFGMSDNVDDDLESLHHHPIVSGIDSAVPLRLSLHGVNFLKNQKANINNAPKRHKYWETIQFGQGAKSNVIWANEAARQGYLSE